MVQLNIKQFFKDKFNFLKDNKKTIFKVVDYTLTGLFIAEMIVTCSPWQALARKPAIIAVEKGILGITRWMKPIKIIKKIIK
jgi:hypothetical protein